MRRGAAYTRRRSWIPASADALKVILETRTLSGEEAIVKAMAASELPKPEPCGEGLYRIKATESKLEITRVWTPG